MKDELISLETSKIAKEKGIANVRTLKYYEFLDDDGTAMDLGWKFKDMEEFLDNIDLPVITQSLLRRWLREKHSIHILIDPDIVFADGPFEYFCFIISEKEGKTEVDNGFKTYEEALEKALQETLKLIKV